jgi:catechol 2,3-dioxygenase-like lactoylglutathione lyase family enzyme
MASTIKSVVFKTPNLNETKSFFENSLDFNIKESSLQHFVLASKGLRIVFLESETDFGIELYVDAKIENRSSFNDPNGIKITVKDFDESL